MEVKAEGYGHAILLHCKGDLTEESLEMFQREVERHLIEGVCDVVVSLKDVGFIDSQGLECLLDLRDRLSESRGQLKLTNPAENVSKVFEMTRLTEQFEILEDMLDAVKVM